jgi:uncharacterized cupin superfamily protein
MPKKIRVDALAPVIGALYPPPFDIPCRARERRMLGDAAGLTQFGVNLLTLPPGAWSSQRHWHTAEDELVYVIKGEVTLLTNAGREILVAGEAAGFKAGDTDGHCLQNHGQDMALVLEIGSCVAADGAHYSDIDLLAPPNARPGTYTHRDGTPYATRTRE